MAISDHMQELYGLPAFDFFDAETKAELPAPSSVAWRISGEPYESGAGWEEEFARFTETVDTTEVRALIVGAWDDVYDEGPDDVIAAIVAARDRLPALRAVFVGDIEFMECEISWINQGLVTPLLDAFRHCASSVSGAVRTWNSPPSGMSDCAHSPSRRAAWTPRSCGTSGPATCPR